MKKKPGQVLQASGELQLSGGGFATADGSKVGENLKLRSRFDTITYTNTGVAVRGALEIRTGEILWGTFFGGMP